MVQPAASGAGTGTTPRSPHSPLPPMSEPAASPPRPRGRWLREVRYWTYAGHLFTISSIAASNILLGLSVLIAGWRRGLRGAARTAVPILVPLGAYLLFLLVSIGFSYEPRVSVRRLGEVLSLATLAVAAINVRGERRVRWLVDGLILVGCGLALWGMGQYLVGYGDLAHRIRGPFSHYMTFAGVLLLCDVLLLARLFFGGWRSWWRWAAFLLLTSAVLGSLTRSAWVGLGVAVTLLVVLRAPKLLVAYLPAALLFALLAPAELRSRAVSIFDLRDPSNYDRLCMLDAGLYMIAERPLFGIGPDLVSKRYPIYRHLTAPRYSVPHLHNALLELTAERGLLSLGTYVWLMLAAILQAWNAYREEGGARGPRADLHLGVALALVAFNVAGLFEDNWGDTEVQRIALFLLAVPFCLAATDPDAPPATAVAAATVPTEPEPTP